MTSAEAAKAVKKLQEKFNSIYDIEKQSKEYIAAVDEDLLMARPKYNYSETQKQLNDLEEKIRTIKHAINVFNTTHKVPGYDMTVDEMLVYIPQLTARINKLYSMKSKLPKKRVSSLSGSRTSSVIEYTYINYDLDAVTADYEAARDELSKAQLALDSLNNSEEFEVPITL